MKTDDGDRISPRAWRRAGMAGQGSELFQAPHKIFLCSSAPLAALDSGALPPWTPKSAFSPKNEMSTIWLKAQEFTRGGHPLSRDRSENFCAPSLLYCESKSKGGKGDRRLGWTNSRRLCQGYDPPSRPVFISINQI